MDPRYQSPANFQVAHLLPALPLAQYADEQNAQRYDQDRLVSGSLAQPSPDIASLSLEKPRCSRCQGRKYGCTAYFHNTSIFPEPPHDLLPSIEESYAAKNRLKSLLLNYVLRTPERAHISVIPRDLAAWEFQVRDLCYKLRDGTTFTLSDTTMAFERLSEWTREMVRKINKHVSGVQRIDLSTLKVEEVLKCFKRLCEEVWRAWLRDRKTGAVLVQSWCQ